MNCDRKLYRTCLENQRDIKPLLQTRKKEYNKENEGKTTPFEMADGDLNKIFELGNYAINSKDYKLLTALVHFWITLYNMDRYLIKNKLCKYKEG